MTESCSQEGLGYFLLEATFVLVRGLVVVVLRHGERDDSNLEPGLGLEFGRDTTSGIFRMAIVTDVLQIKGDMGKWK
jgi:hypothetical protein